MGKSLSLHLTTKLSASTVLDLVLLNGKGHTLTRWVIHAEKGDHLLTLLQLSKARHDTLRVAQTGTTKPKTFRLILGI